jgi:5-methylcytosine-specific restriction endonuclease McrA
MWGPKEAMVTVRRSIVSAQTWARARGEEIDESRALGLTYAYYLGEFQQHRRGRKPPRVRMTVFARKDGLCQVPGCTNAVHHLHHIVYRSNQGGDEVTNLLGICKLCRYRHN